MERVPIMRPIAIVLTVLALGLALGGCSKCGFFWQDGPKACQK